MRALLVLLIASTAVLSTSCNTIIGLGRDMRIAGEGMENIANKASGGSSADDTHGGAPVY